jgi:hypothetical protein
LVTPETVGAVVSRSIVVEACVAELPAASSTSAVTVIEPSSSPLISASLPLNVQLSLLTVVVAVTTEFVPSSKLTVTVWPSSALLEPLTSTSLASDALTTSSDSIELSIEIVGDVVSKSMVVEACVAELPAASSTSAVTVIEPEN